MPDILYALALVAVGYIIAGLTDMIKCRYNLNLAFLYAIVAAIIIGTTFLVGGALVGIGWAGLTRMSDSPFLILLFAIACGFSCAMLSAGMNNRYKTKLGFLFAIGTIGLITSVSLISGLLVEKIWGGLPAKLIESKWLDLKPDVFFENPAVSLTVGLVTGIILGLGANWTIRRRNQSEPPVKHDEAQVSESPPTPAA